VDYKAYEDDKLYCLDLDTFVTTAVYTFPEGTSFVAVHYNKLYLQENQNLIIYDLETGTSQTINIGSDISVHFMPDGKIYLLDSEKVLWSLSESGEMKKLLNNFTASSFVISGRTVYLNGYMWKIVLSAEPIVLESNIIH